jgi:hypothetical protein
MGSGDILRAGLPVCMVVVAAGARSFFGIMGAWDPGHLKSFAF